MKNMTDKTKRWLTIAGLGIICVALVAVIGSKFITERPVDELPPISDAAQGDVNPSPDSGVGQKAGEKEVAVKPNPQTLNPSETGAPAVSSGTEQTIQADLVKPKEPTNAEKTDPAQTPDGEKVTDPKPVDHDNVPKPDTTPKPNEPQGGDKNDKGQVYFPGFGWIDDDGANTGETVGSDGDINKQVGDMN